MRIHWGFKEEILRLLSEAALAPSDSSDQELLLNEACILLWRFDEGILPRSARDIHHLLSVDISIWLPQSVNLLYTGQLLINGRPTVLPMIILTDIAGYSLNLRDKIISDAIASYRNSKTISTNFRSLVTQQKFSGVIERENAFNPYTLSFYEPISEIGDAVDSEANILICRDCSYPLDSADDYFTCRSPFCTNVRYSVHPPHPPIPFDRRQKPMNKASVLGSFQLKHIIWRTVASPLQLERRMIKYFKKVLPSPTFSTLSPIDGRPGISIREGDRIVQLEPVATHSAVTVENYYANLDNVNATWLIVPDGTGLLFRHLKARLPDNYSIVTARSYPYEYLATFHGSGKRGGPRIRCQ